MVAEPKEATDTVYYFLKANVKLINGSISMILKYYNINYQYLQGIVSIGKLTLSTVISIYSIALNRPTQSSLAVLGEISIGGSMIKVEELANALQKCLDSGGKENPASDYVNNGYGNRASGAERKLSDYFLPERGGCDV